MSTPKPYRGTDGENTVAASLQAQVESLAEFHRGVETAYHRWSNGMITDGEYVVETAKLLIVLPAVD